jgi:proline iminopeptidase
MKQIITLILIIFCFIGCSKLDPNIDGNLVAKTVDEDASLPSVTLSKTQLHCQTFGNKNGVKIFMLEGGPGNDFRYLLAMNKVVNGWSLLQNYQLIYHDYRGSGLSKRHPISELSIPVLLTDLEELIDKYAPNQKVILIGHSHGGFVAAQYVNAHPERVKGVVFIEPGAFSRAINDKTIDVTSANYFGKDVNELIWLRQLISADNHPKADYQFSLTAAIYSDPLRGQSCPAQTYRFGLAASLAIAFEEVVKGQYDYTTNLSKFTNKVLFISSDQTKDIGYDFQEKNQVTFFPNHQHIKEVGTGHSGLINCRTDETLGYIKTYLGGL